MQRFRGDLETKGDTLFQDLIRKYIVHKPCFTFSIQGSEEFSKSLDDEEQTRLREKITALDEQDKKTSLNVVYCYRRNKMKKKIYRVYLPYK